jgi:hypothetical protein
MEELRTKLNPCGGGSKPVQEKWNEVWYLLFPDWKPSPSAHIVGSPEKEAFLLLRQFWERRKSEVIEKFLDIDASDQELEIRRTAVTEVMSALFDVLDSLPEDGGQRKHTSAEMKPKGSGIQASTIATTTSHSLPTVKTTSSPRVSPSPMEVEPYMEQLSNASLDNQLPLLLTEPSQDEPFTDNADYILWNTYQYDTHSALGFPEVDYMDLINLDGGYSEELAGVGQWTMPGYPVDDVENGLLSYTSPHFPL